jgi:hypothetical protein
MAYTDRSPIIMQGKVFIEERQFNGPILTAREWIGNSDNFMLSFKQKREVIEDNFSGRGLTLAAPVVTTGVEVSFNMIDLHTRNLARASWGTTTGLQDAQTGVSETHLVSKGSYIQLANPSVSNVTVSGLTVDTDYVVDRSGLGGLIHILDTSPTAPDIDAAPLEVTVTYDCAANNGRVEGMVTLQKFYRLTMNGINVAQGGQAHILTVHQFQMDAWKKADFIDKKQMKLETGGEILLDQSIPDDGVLSQVFSLVKA